MEKILEGIKNFLSTGNNLTVVIVILAIVLVLLIAVIVTSIQKRNVEKKVAKEEALLNEEEAIENKPLDIETIVLSPIVDEEEESGAVVVNNETATQIADETVIMTPVREKKRPVKMPKNIVHIPQEKVSSFGEPNPSSNDGKLPGTVQIYKDTEGKYRFRFHSSNKFTLGHSQGYLAKAACKSGIRAVVRAAKNANVVEVADENYVSLIGKSVFEIYKDKEDKFRFRLMSANAMNILASQGYSSKTNCLKGIESIRRIAEFHTIVDDTLA